MKMTLFIDRATRSVKNCTKHDRFELNLNEKRPWTSIFYWNLAITGQLIYRLQQTSGVTLGYILTFRVSKGLETSGLKRYQGAN